MSFSGDRGRLGRLAFSRSARWSATLNFEIGQTTYPVNRGREVREKGVRDKVRERRRGKEGVEWGTGPLDVCAVATRVRGYATHDVEQYVVPPPVGCT